jgi:putative N-acetyltransferase (TIGR04045 family)
MIFDPLPRYRPGRIDFVLATERWQIAGYHRLRFSIFCQEQDLFHDSDIDEIDRIAYPITAVVHTAGMPDTVVGVVRIYEDPERPGTWFGGRLGTDPAFRSAGAIGAGLIRKAVSTAHAWGCRQFLAYVQERNERLFQRLHWHTLGRVEHEGLPHAHMEADLNHYPPVDPVEWPDRTASFPTWKTIQQTV